MIVESALPLKHISLVELITTERTGALGNEESKLTKITISKVEFNLSVDDGQQMH